MATLLKEHQGEVTDNTTLCELFPKFKFAEIEPCKVNVRHLLTHTSGIDNHPLVLATAYTGIHSPTLRQALVENSYPHKTAALNQFEYTNVGYNILSVWFENQFQQSWQQTLHDSVLKPLKMQRTSALMSDVKKNNWRLARATRLKVKTHGSRYICKKKDNTMQAAGGMISTAQDLSRFLIAQLNQGQVDGQQIFPREVIQKSQPATDDF